MKSIIAAIVLTILAAGLGSTQTKSAGADNRSDSARGVSDSEQVLRGQGELKIQGRLRYRPDRATVEVRTDGTFEIKLNTPPDGEFKGTWTRGKGNDLMLKVRNAFGDRNADGGGTLDIAPGNGQIKSLKLLGQCRIGGFELTMVAGAGGATPGRAPVRAIDSTRKGSGTFTLGGRQSRLTEAQVRLERNGDARIVIIGREREIFDGKWSEDGFGRVSMDIRRAMGTNNASGRARIMIRGSDFTSFEMSGRVRDERFDAKFDAFAR
jgi:hypothetical protein